MKNLSKYFFLVFTLAVLLGGLVGGLYLLGNATFREEKAAETGSSCPNLLSNNNSLAAPDIPPPAYRQTITDPVFGSKITRITGDPGTAIPNVSGATWQTQNRHRYFTLPVWSADGKLLYISDLNLFLDGETNQPIKILKPRGAISLWHPAMPDTMIEASGSQITFLNIRTGERSVAIDDPAYTDFYFNTRTAPSYDGKFVGVTARRARDSKIVCIVWNLETKVHSPDLDFAALGFIGEDTTGTNAYRCSPTATGEYIHVDGWTTDHNNNNRFFDWNGNLVSEVLHNNKECPGHGDMCVDANGTDVRVGISKDASQGVGTVGFVVPNGLPIVEVDSDRTASFSSCRNSSAPGWAYGSSYGANGEIWRIALDGSYNGNARIERIAHVHDAAHCGYYCEPHAVPSPDGKKVLWAGNWDGKLSGVHTFVADVSDLCPGGSITTPTPTPTGEANILLKVKFQGI